MYLYKAMTVLKQTNRTKDFLDGPIIIKNRGYAIKLKNNKRKGK